MTNHRPWPWIWMLYELVFRDIYRQERAVEEWIDLGGEA